ncbi:hypothetical protein [Manganibacter manganicus]|uniref:Uncharacterized protein n=1 Tax=Manganibacter manganicus TaxID=1873176 RepID=A0A1V8RJU3_9HYPH|nr:hypothetical protein [Pseudaminobacter manganicus]OQM73386.1 hypothetical protein BFN67_08785 [Pseudaminobacter manganicus]
MSREFLPGQIIAYPYLWAWQQERGLGDLSRCWIVVDEYNYDIAERSWYIEPGGQALGRFSKAFVMKIATALAEARTSGRRVNRLE